MRILSLQIENYRTLESLDLTFPSSYAAICGANDSGKTNVVRAIRALVRGEDRYPGMYFDDDEELALKNDYPKWKDTEPAQRQITVAIGLRLDKTRDIGLCQSIVKQLALTQPDGDLDLTISARYSPERSEPSVTVRVDEAVFEDLNAQEVLKRLQSSRGILFHNSTEVNSRFMYPGRSVAGHIRELTGQHEALVNSLKKTVNRGLAKISRKQQSEFEGLLGRLRDKYRVGLSLPSFDFGFMPFGITLGDRKVEVPLDDWGSGTRNRTMVLLTLFRARQIGESEESAGKVTPVIIVEEPESFLHPSAQAEFGRVLQDLAEEFRVQVLVTTHSPYLLSLRDPASNILLRRKLAYRQLRETERVETTGNGWMAPFSQALGLDSEEFGPWKDMMISDADAVILVEGSTDKEYFEMLRDASHGQNRLDFQGEILTYDGTGSLCNTVLLRFVKNRYRRFFVTFDLDAAQQVERSLVSLQLEKGTHYLPVGIDGAGKRNIEGLLPDSVTTAVYASNSGLVQAATSGTKDEQDSAKGRLKKLLLEEFKRNATPGAEYFGHFYALSRAINRALVKESRA
jgi:putative ATP-dependent endonuclease of OLD family